MNQPTIEQYTSTLFPVNAYLVTSPAGTVVVDAAFGVSDGRALRKRVDALGRPFTGVLLTHPHPDHYGGLSNLVAGTDVPVFAAPAVAEIARGDDPIKESILRPMFGDEWPQVRSFPTEPVADDSSVDLAGMRFALADIGPAESHHDSIWYLGDDHEVAFCGDVAYDHMHAYLADGHPAEWLEVINRLQQDLTPRTRLHLGHGDPVGPTALSDQRRYIEAFVEAVETADFTDEARATQQVVASMRRVLPSDDLAFLMELSVVPLATALGKSVSPPGPNGANIR